MKFPPTKRKPDYGLDKEIIKPWRKLHQTHQWWEWIFSHKSRIRNRDGKMCWCGWMEEPCGRRSMNSPVGTFMEFRSLSFFVRHIRENRNSTWVDFRVFRKSSDGKMLSCSDLRRQHEATRWKFLLLRNETRIITAGQVDGWNLFFFTMTDDVIKRIFWVFSRFCVKETLFFNFTVSSSMLPHFAMRIISNTRRISQRSEK